MQVMNRWIRVITVVAFFAVVASGAFAQQGGKRIKLLGLSVEGNKTVDENLVKLTSGLVVGTYITADDIQTAIKQLWDLGMFADIQVLLDRQIGNNLYLTIKVEEYPHLSEIQITGNKKVKEKDLKKELDFFRGQMVSPAKISKARRQMLAIYRDKGYLLADITTEVVPVKDNPNRVIVKFKIKEGNKVQVKKIRFHGNKAFSDGKLKKKMKEIKEDTWWRGADFDPEKYATAKKNVIDFYRSQGFRDVEIVRDSLYYGPEKKDMFIDIWVDEGRRYYIGKIEFEGNEIYTEEQLRSVLGFKEGDVYNAEKLQKAVSENLGSLYYDAGYIYAGITPREIPVGQDTVNIRFMINEGTAVKIRKISIVGNTRTKEKVIRRELYILPGQTFSRDLLMRSARQVWVLNYFANVNPKVEPVDDENVDVIFEVEEKSTDTANMSAGWSERDKVIGSIGVSMNNLMGNGQRLSFDWNFGRYYRSFQISFTEPWLMDSPTLLGVNFYDTRRDSRWIGYAQKSIGGSIRVGRRFRWPDSYFRGDWIYRIDKTELYDFSRFIRELNPNGIVTEQWPLTSSSITQIISRNSLNRPEFPTEGSNFSLSTEIAGGILGGNVSYHKHQFKAQWFSPLALNFVLHSNFEAGVIVPFGKKPRVPYLDHFFMGGEGLTRSIPLRGYNDPLGSNGNGLGGQVMMKYTMEIRFPISPNPTIYALAFAEAGNTWLDLKRTDPFDLRRSVGIGARVFMPMLGMIGFDYAYGFDNIDRRTGRRVGRWKPHFVFGRGF